MADQSEPDAEEQFSALLEGLRATLPGVEVLFAFLLVLPFQNGFSKLDVFEKRLYAVAFGVSAVASHLTPDSGEPRNVELVNLGTFVGALCFLVGAALLLPERAQTE